MADYIVTTRNADGALEERAYTAEDRADLFKKMAADGVTAVKVQEGVAGKKPRKAMKAAPSKYRGLVAATIVVLGAGAALFFLMPKSENSLEEKKDVKRQIKPAIADVAKTNLEVKAEVKEEQPKRVTKKGTPIPDRVQKDEKGVYRYPNGQRWVDPNNLNIVKHPKPRLLFKHTSENQIAVMLRLDPARMAPFLIGRRLPYGERFVKDFIDSLDDTIVIDKNDTPEEAELRKAVLETKADLKAAMDRGEDIAKIMNDTQKELDRLCQYHNDLKKMVKEAIDNPKFSDEDVEDYVNAANELLKKQGLNGLTMPKLVNRQARLLMMSERKKALEARKQGK